MVEAVNEAFINLFEDGLIYRDNALVNWCCHLQSALSDIEVQAKEISGPTYLHVPGYKKPVKFGIMTEFAYKLADRGTIMSFFYIHKRSSNLNTRKVVI